MSASLAPAALPSGKGNTMRRSLQLAPVSRARAVPLYNPSASQELRTASGGSRMLIAISRRAGYQLLVCLFVSTFAVAAQELSSAKPESVGLSSERLERITSKVQQEIDHKRIAGAVTLVARHGKVAWFKSQGALDREANKPMRDDSLFRICSMTKPITSLAVMMLYEEGKFLLEDPISKYLPEFKNPKVLVKQATGGSSTALQPRHAVGIQSEHRRSWPSRGSRLWDAARSVFPDTHL